MKFKVNIQSKDDNRDRSINGNVNSPDNNFPPSPAAPQGQRSIKYNPSHIVQGTVNNIIKKTRFADPEVEAKAAERLAICNTCEHKDGNVCGLCGCPLQSKTRSNSNCPDNRW